MQRKMILLILTLVLVAISVAPAFAGAGGMAKGKAVGIHKSSFSGNVPIHPVCSNCHVPDQFPASCGVGTMGCH